MRYLLLLLLLLLSIGSSGCGTLRAIEQYKCDRWGMCYFGIQPTPTYPPGQVYIPQPTTCPSPY